MFSSSLQSSWKLKGKDIGRSNDIQGRRAVDLVSNEVWKGTLHWSRPSNRLFLACRQAGKGVRPSCEGVLRGWRGPLSLAVCGAGPTAEQCLPGFSGLTSSFPGTNCLITRRVTELPVEMSTTPTKKNVICVLLGSRYDEGPHYSQVKKQPTLANAYNFLRRKPGQNVLVAVCCSLIVFKCIRLPSRGSRSQIFKPRITSKIP